jgi:hypothetical protein
MSISSQEVQMLKEEFAKRHMVQDAKLIQDVVDPAMNYDDLGENEYLNIAFNEMKTMFIGHNFEDNKNPPDATDDKTSVFIAGRRWPAIAPAISQFYDRINRIPFSSIFAPTTHLELYNTESFKAATEIDFLTPYHKMIAKYRGGFHINKAIIRAKFVGDETRHVFSIGEYERLLGVILIGNIVDSDTEAPQAFLMDNCYPPLPVFAELEEFMMLAVTKGHDDKNYMEPRAVNTDLATFTCYNKARKLSCDTVASFSRGLCDPETIFSGSDSEDVPSL